MPCVNISEKATSFKARVSHLIHYLFPENSGTGKCLKICLQSSICATCMSSLNIWKFQLKILNGQANTLSRWLLQIVVNQAD